MRKQPPFRLGSPVPAHLYVGRRRQLEQIGRAIKAKQHVLIYGSRYIGKTSTINTVQELIKDEEDKVLRLRLESLTSEYQSLFFLFRKLVLDICCILLEQNDEGSSFVVRIPASNVSIEHKRVDDFEPNCYDLYKIVDAIMLMAQQREYTKLVLFIDNINRNLGCLVSEEGEQILRFLSEKNIVIVASAREDDYKKLYRDTSCLAPVKIGGFDSSDDVIELLELYTNPPLYNEPKLNFPREVINLIWEITDGYPSPVQEIFYRCYLESSMLGLTEVSKEMVEKIVLDRSKYLFSFVNRPRRESDAQV